MKKNNLTFCVSLFILLGVTTHAQTADEIISKHVEARGGAEKLKALQTMVMEGSMNQGGTEIVMKYYYSNNKATKVEFSVMGQTGYNLVTTTEGWKFNPFAGNTEPEALTPEELKDAQSQLDLQGPLFDYKAKGHTVEYLGKVSEQGQEFFKLKLTRAGGKVATYFLDKNYLMAKAITTSLAQGSEQEVIAEYSDYRKTPEGYMIAFKRISGANEISFDKAEINPKIDDAVFKPAK